MNKCICTLEPKAIWENFYNLTQVPRPSNHEEKAREFVMNWAKENGIHAEMDEAHNILLSKPGHGKPQRSHPARSLGHGASKK